MTDDEEDLIDDAADDDTLPTARYDITSYGIDFDVDGLVRRLEKNKVRIPVFQRSYVWSLPEASRFVESILLGLPVPGIFLAKEPVDEALLVIDGQQRLKSLQFFKSGHFNPREEDSKHRVFKLERVHPRFVGRTYATLEETDRQILDDSVIHATVIKQESPNDNDTSIYHVFERLNSGGQKLTPQEIRTAVFHGKLVELLKTLNDDAAWRALYGKKSARHKDEELVLRFVALANDVDNYQRPMAEFLSKFAKQNRSPGKNFLSKTTREFRYVAATLIAMGRETVRPEGIFNAAVFDAVAVGLIRNASPNLASPDIKSLNRALKKLMGLPEFEATTSKSTSDENAVKKRIELATRYLAG